MSKILIKYGGSAMENRELAQFFAQSIKKIHDLGHELILTHGGGPHINVMLEKLNIQSEFINGLRVTSKEAMEVVEMVLKGTVNSMLITLFKQVGLNAVGVSGKDNATLRAKPINTELGYVGEVSAVDTSLLTTLLENDFFPIVCPIGYGEHGESLNINADTASGSLAGALNADIFILITDVTGVLDKTKSLITHLSLEEIKRLKKEGIISGGMIPKVDSCLNALYNGCSKAYIIDGRQVGTLDKLIILDDNTGTLITLD